MEPLTAGRVARRLLAFFKKDGSNWVQNWFAHDRRGRIVSPESPQAVRFCVLGACRNILMTDRSSIRENRYFEAVNTLSDALNCSTAGWNDRCPDFQTFRARLHEIARTP